MDDHIHPLRLCWDKFRFIAFITHCSASPNLYPNSRPYTRTDLYSHSHSIPHADSKSA
jgi:hypothetical protein